MTRLSPYLPVTDARTRDDELKQRLRAVGVDHRAATARRVELVIETRALEVPTATVAAAAQLSGPTVLTWTRDAQAREEAQHESPENPVTGAVVSIPESRAVAALDELTVVVAELKVLTETREQLAREARAVCMTHAEIAEALGVNQSAVRGWLRRPRDPSAVEAEALDRQQAAKAAALEKLRAADKEIDLAVAKRSLMALNASEVGVTIATVGETVGKSEFTAARWIRAAREQRRGDQVEGSRNGAIRSAEVDR